jgi:hypothetical protein
MYHGMGPGIFASPYPLKVDKKGDRVDTPAARFLILLARILKTDCL